MCALIFFKVSFSFNYVNYPVIKLLLCKIVCAHLWKPGQTFSSGKLNVLLIPFYFQLINEIYAQLCTIHKKHAAFHNSEYDPVNVL